MRYFTSTVNIGRFCRTTLLLIVHVSVALCTGNYIATSQCCRRVPNLQVIGYDVSGRPVKLDTGRCSTSCEDSLFRGSHYISVLERIRNTKATLSGDRTCSNVNVRKTCEADTVHVHTASIGHGPRPVDVIDSCQCRKVSMRCKRFPKIKRFFAGTEYEATVDVGECAGGCRKGGKACRPVRTTTHPILGPNGMITVQSITECKCEATCFRQHFNVAVIERVFNETSRAYEQRTKLIDIGRCTGTCSAIERCVVRSKRKNSLLQSTAKCLMALETNDVTCVAKRVHAVKYTSVEGKVVQVMQVRRCGCS